MITETLARFAAETTPDVVSPGAARMLQLSLLDWAAVGLAGADEPVSHITRDAALDDAAPGQAGLIGHTARLTPRAAALVNGTVSHALDYDDTHFAHIGHPSVAVLPAALALAQHLGAGGDAFRHAALIGVEASIRVGVWLGRSHYQAGFHQTGTAGAFGAGLAAARLLGLDRAGCAMVLGLLSTRAGGLKSQFGTMGKPLNAGLAAANGVEAAMLVARGFQAKADALEVAQGFGPTHHGENITSALEGIANDWVFESVSHKFHACCHGLHAALEAAATLPRVSPDDIQRITVHTHPRWMTVCNQVAPTTGLGAKFSYATVLAMQVLGHDTARLDSYSDALCIDPAICALRRRVEVVADDSVPETAARLVRTTQDASAEAVHDLSGPMTLAHRETKLMEKARSLLGLSTADAIWAVIDRGADPLELREGLSAAIHRS